MKAEILRLGKDSIIYGVGSVITRFVGLFTLPLFTAYLTPEEYGVLAMLTLLCMVAQPVFSLGLSAAMGPSYFEKDDPDNKSEAVWSVFGINFVSASLLVGLAWALPAFLGELVRLPPKYSYLVSLSLTGTALTILVTSLTQRVQFEKQASLYVVITVVTALSAILISIYTVIFLNRGVEGIIYGQVAGNVITFFSFFMLGLKSTKPRISGRMVNELLRLGLPLMPSFAFLFILMHSNKYILEWHSGLGSVGVYSIGFNLGMAISIITGGIASAWYPFFMKYQNDQIKAEIIFGKIFTYYTIGIGALTLIFFIFARPVVMLLTNENFHDAYIVVGLAASSLYFMGMYDLFLPGLYFRKEIAAQSLIQGVAVIFSLPITFLLVINLEIFGAALAVALGHLLMAVFTHSWNIYRRKDYIVIKYEWARIAKFSIFFVCIASVFTAVKFNSLGANLAFSFFGAILVCVLVVQLILRSEIDLIPFARRFKA